MAEVVSVRFRTAGKLYYFDPLDFEIKKGDHVIVETARGMEYGTVIGERREVAEENIVRPLKPIIRIATPEDDEKEADNLAVREDAYKICKEKIAKHGVSQPDKGLNLRMRIVWLFSICYILPIIVAAILASQYLIELKSFILANEEQKNYKRLSEIDSGFSRFITSKLIEYRKLNEELTENVENQGYIKDKLIQMCNDCLIDSAHLLSSDSQLLLSSALISSEVRRHRDKSLKEKQEIYDSWFNRGAILTQTHRNHLFNEKDALYYPEESERREAHKAFTKVFSSTAASSMDYYNQSKNISTNSFKKKTNLQSSVVHFDNGLVSLG